MPRLAQVPAGWQYGNICDVRVALVAMVCITSGQGVAHIMTIKRNSRHERCGWHKTTSCSQSGTVWSSAPRGVLRSHHQFTHNTDIDTISMVLYCIKYGFHNVYSKRAPQAEVTHPVLTTRGARGRGGLGRR